MNNLYLAIGWNRNYLRIIFQKKSENESDRLIVGRKDIAKLEWST